MEKTQLGYISGFFDADGSVGYYRLVDKKRRTESTSLRLSFSNSHKATLQSIRELLKEEGMTGQIREYTSPSGKPQFVLIYATRQAYNVLSFLLPYLKTKRSHAEKCLKAHITRSKEPVKVRG